VIHEKARLGIMTSLAAHPKGLSFGDLKQLCALTDGNLNRHLDVLHEAGLVQVKKERGNHRPLTSCRLTPAGLAEFDRYLSELERVVADAALAARASAAATRKGVAGASPA
jgi:DNA-binding MarR family transcriptional regulator